jgi:RNA polymerase sigma-70 factor (ECF subfamily)
VKLQKQGGEVMTDAQIITLYQERSESAIGETEKRYGSYCHAIAMNILHSREDAEECVNDTLLKAWNSIPPQTPAILSSFLGKITRNISIDKYNARKAKKRQGDENSVPLSELEVCFPDLSNVENEVDTKILGQTIEKFLYTVKKNDRIFFVRRYWYNDSISAIAERFSAGESKVMVNLFRTRNKLKLYLQKEGLI